MPRQLVMAIQDSEGRRGTPKYGDLKTRERTQKRKMKKWNY